MALRVIFIGTGDIAIPAFRSLADNPETELIALITGEDKPVGRKQVLTPPAIKTAAGELDIPVHQPAKIRHFATEISGMSPDVIAVMAYGQILRKAVLEAPRLACLNLHASLLPLHRGASPIQAAVRSGAPASGITVMYMDEGLDTGDILLSEELVLAGDETGGTLHDRLARTAHSALTKALGLLASGTAPRTPQDDSSATHSGKLTRADGVLDWSLPAVELERLIRAYEPWPGTSATLHQDGHPPLRCKIFPPASVSRHRGEPGAVIDTGNGITVAAGDRSLTLTQIQPEGRRRMGVTDFLKGHPLGCGAHFKDRPE